MPTTMHALTRNMASKEGKRKESKTSIGLLSIPECGFAWDNEQAMPTKIETSSEEEEVEAEPPKKKTKLSAAERREQERLKEREIRRREEALASNQIPNSTDAFDRLVLSSPDSSLVWLQYIAYHLQGTELDKARTIAKRAIKTINIREENEQLNIWFGWLNMESKYGTSHTLNDVFQNAIKTNDPFKVYVHMLTVYTDAGQEVDLVKLVNSMIGKFKQNLEMWIECGSALLKIGLKEKSRHIMQRALQSLPASQHIDLLVRFASLENKLGDKDRGQVLFEEILKSYPKRVDVWTSYVDALIKCEEIDKARGVLGRACVQTLPGRKMRTLFKKFINFEEKYGTSEAVGRVQQMAADYVASQMEK